MSSTTERSTATPVPANTYRPTTTPVTGKNVQPSTPGPRYLARPEAALAGFTRFAAAHSITLLRVAVGLVFLGFGALKFFPGMSPAAELAERTIGVLTLHHVGPAPALLLTAVMETFIGLTLLTGRLLKVGLVTLAFALVGIMSPLVIFFGELFPAGGPTLTAQYVLKDVIIATAGLVVAAWALGARLQPPQR